MDDSSPSSSAKTHHDDLLPHRMKRNKAFQPDREPFQHLPQLQIRPSRANGPFSFLNPTSVHLRLNHDVTSFPGKSAADETPSTTIPLDGKPMPAGQNVNYKWTSRNNRKGRHALAVDPHVPESAVSYWPLTPTSSAREIARGLVRMFTYYPVWDVSYLVAIVFTLGSIVWVFNAFFVFLPLVQSSSEFSGEILYGGGITAFIGATIFEFGSFLLMAEAVNENRTGCFGWAVEQLEEEIKEKSGIRYRLRPSYSDCEHHHANKHNLVGKPKRASSSGQQEAPQSNDSDTRSWVWWPGWSELRSHYFHEIGFLACLSQLFGATVFWISGFTALPGIYDHMSTGLMDGVYWAPQVIGGTGFIVSGVLFMIETQPKWYVPAPKVLGWHIGLWNLIGGIGFTLCPAFGFDTASWAQYQASCSTFWGSWAFLIGSVIQWYESLDKHPVEKEDLGDVES